MQGNFAVCKWAKFGLVKKVKFLIQKGTEHFQKTTKKIFKHQFQFQFVLYHRQPNVAAHRTRLITLFTVKSRTLTQNASLGRALCGRIMLQMRCSRHIEKLLLLCKKSARQICSGLDHESTCID